MQERPELMSQLSAIDNAMAQDMCLPSPSLSPVAAMNALHGESSFESEGLDVDTDSSLDHNVSRFSKVLRLQDADETRVNDHSLASSRSPPSLLDMPKVLEFFDSVPDEVKTYLMYQFLRRCPKPTLHFVADVVNPTLKCDFLTLLPLELSLNIVKYLDVQTMCRAAQVSKRWRHITNSDEKSWRNLLEQDGYHLSDGELERAIRQGWGWQLSSGPEDHEEDLSVLTPSRADMEGSPVPSMAGPSSRSPLGSLPISRRGKRKANTRASSRKLAKRKVSSSGGELPDPDWRRDIAASEAPYAAASAAAGGAMDHMVKVWSLDDGAILYNLEGHTSLVGLLALEHDFLVSAAADSTLRIWDSVHGHCKNTLSAHTGAITCFQHDGQKVISGSDRTLKMWDVRNGECVRDLLTDLSGVWQVKFNDRRCVAAVQRDSLTYIEVLDFGAARDGVPESKLAKRIVVNRRGQEVLGGIEDDDDLSD
ncbi:hypothetical protein DTO012A8_9416 [Penicillium roqueforti]|nr:hypothetical protein DTO012A8_9416 [Penicillium roqueforti]